MNRSCSAKRIVGVIACILTVAACRTVRLPICERLSRSRPSAIAGIGKIVYDECHARGITITILSSSAAQFKGPTSQVAWLQRNYHLLICDFDYSNIHIRTSDYTTCETHAKEWIAALMADKPENLMVNGSMFCEVCRPNLICH